MPSGTDDLYYFLGQTRVKISFRGCFWTPLIHNPRTLEPWVITSNNWFLFPGMKPGTSSHNFLPLLTTLHDLISTLTFVFCISTGKPIWFVSPKTKTRSWRDSSFELVSAQFKGSTPRSPTAARPPFILRVSSTQELRVSPRSQFHDAGMEPPQSGV